jgi:hypothetical protein
VRRHIAWLLVGILTSAVIALTAFLELSRYWEFRCAWPWDLAYYNQWFWALLFGDGNLTVRPFGNFGVEGPSIWRANYLAPVRFIIVPFYWIYPSPCTLLIFQSVIFWLCIPAAFRLTWSESGSVAVALSAVILVPLTPLLWPMAQNDFRELQVGLPFIVWAVHAYRERIKWLAVVSVLCLLACRQEYALVVATLAFVRSRVPEKTHHGRRWAAAAIATGVTWAAVYFAYLAASSGTEAPQEYVRQFGANSLPFGQRMTMASALVFIGLASWAVLASLAPRVFLMCVPWALALPSGLFDLQMLSAPRWTRVRYAAPLVGVILSAGLIGYAHIGRWAAGHRRGSSILVLVWLATSTGLVAATHDIFSRMARVPAWVQPSDVSPAWEWIGRVKPDEGVLSSYEFAPPLSTRRLLFSEAIPLNHPPGFPRLLPEIRWIFIKPQGVPWTVFTSQGFRPVYRGHSVWILHRDRKDDP